MLDEWYNSLYTNEVFDRTDQCGVLAQLGEHLPYKQRVTGSSPVGPMISPTFIRNQYYNMAR